MEKTKKSGRESLGMKKKYFVFETFMVAVCLRVKRKAELMFGFRIYWGVLLRQFVDVDRQLRLQVSSLVLVDDVNLSQLIQHLLYLWVHGNGFSLVCSCTELSNGVTHSLSVIAVMKSSLFFLSDSLD